MYEADDVRLHRSRKHEDLNQRAYLKIFLDSKLQLQAYVFLKQKPKLPIQASQKPDQIKPPSLRYSCPFLKNLLETYRFLKGTFAVLGGP